MKGSYDLLVVGAGPAGCALSILVARAGFRVLMLERRRTPKDDLVQMFPLELTTLLPSMKIPIRTCDPDDNCLRDLVRFCGESFITNETSYPMRAQAIYVDRKSLRNKLLKLAQDSRVTIAIGQRVLG